MIVTFERDIRAAIAILIFKNREDVASSTLCIIPQLLIAVKLCRLGYF